MNKTMGAFLHITSEQLGDPSKGYANVLGIPTLQTGVFGGIIVGRSPLGVTISFTIFHYHHI